MKKIILLVTLAILACNSSQKTTNKATESVPQQSDQSVVYAQTITEQDLKTHLFTYASDEFEGRDTGSPGQKKAVEYLKAQYSALGIKAAKANGDYLQKVPLEIAKMPSGSIRINKNSYEIGEDFVTFSHLVTKTDQIVFASYGIETETYSDYKNLSVKDKIVFITFGEPQAEDGTPLLSKDGKPSRWANFNESLADRIKIASEKGAKALLIYEDRNFSRLGSRFNYLARNNREVMAISTDLTGEVTPIFVGKKLGEDLINLFGQQNQGPILEGNFDFEVKSGNTKIDSENVLAFIEGKELPQEFVIVSSHLDHIGVTASGEINNGADDDGSGTVAVLEIAEALKKAADQGHGPKRSVVFLHVTGEEKGLLGSRFYTDYEPIFPLANTVANLNIDMIGRIDPKRQGDRNYVYLIGSDKLSTELHELSETVNEKFTNIELDYTYNDENDPNRFYYRSDHYNFAKNNIPIIFYFNGTHEDYHKPSDTPDKINYDLLQNRTRLVFHTLWEIANRPNRIVVDKASK